MSVYEYKVKDNRLTNNISIKIIIKYARNFFNGKVCSEGTSGGTVVKL
jgi:hypothetical protein